jgi:hypothetical protein
MPPAKGVKPKIRNRKLRNDVNWQGAINQKGVKQVLCIQETVCIKSIMGHEACTTTVLRFI